MRLIIIIPAYNEEKTIEQVIKSIPKKIDGIDEIKTFVINDGSTDMTKTISLRAGANKVINNKKNLGLARTFNRGLNEALFADADIIVNTDADNQYNQKEISQLVEPIIRGHADMTIGDRQIAKLSFMRPGNKYGNLFGSWVLRKVTGTDVIDASSGFRAFSRETALKININFNHTYTHETIIQATFNGTKIVNVPIEFGSRPAGKSKLINSLFSHIKKSLITIVRTILIYKPLKTLLCLSFLAILPGIFLCLRFLSYYVFSGGSGKIQSLILASIFIIVGFFIATLGLIGDLIANNRRLNEKTLYYTKKMYMKNEKSHK